MDTPELVDPRKLITDWSTSCSEEINRVTNEFLIAHGANSTNAHEIVIEHVNSWRLRQPPGSINVVIRRNGVKIGVVVGRIHHEDGGVRFEVESRAVDGPTIQDAAEKLDGLLREAGVAWFVTVGLRDGNDPGLTVYVADCSHWYWQIIQMVPPVYKGFTVRVEECGFPIPAIEMRRNK